MDWLDLKEEDWVVYGFSSMNEWRGVIREMNIDGFHKFIKEFLPRKEFSFAASNSDEPGKDMELGLKFWLMTNYCESMSMDGTLSSMGYKPE